MDEHLRHSESLDDGTLGPRFRDPAGREGPPRRPANHALRVTLGEESIFAGGQLVHSTVEQLLVAIRDYAGRGLLEVVLDLSAVTDLDYQAIAAISVAQQRAGNEGRVLRVRTADRSMRAALTGCHADPDPLSDVTTSGPLQLPPPAPEMGYRAWSKDS